jgi:hypothetical protein
MRTTRGPSDTRRRPQRPRYSNHHQGGDLPMAARKKKATRKKAAKKKAGRKKASRKK